MCEKVDEQRGREEVGKKIPEHTRAEHGALCGARSHDLNHMILIMT